MPFTAKPARQCSEQQTHFMRLRVSFDTPGIGTANTVQIGTLPANAFIADVDVRIVTVFNAVTTNVLTVGTNAANNNIVDAGGVNEASVATTNVALGRGLLITDESPVYVRYTQSGTAATTGVADIIIQFVPDL